MQNYKTFFPYPIHLLIYLISAITFAYFLDVSMVDDGLRHIAFAAHPDIMKSWGDVYPHSLFNDYDLWYVWHQIIRFFLLFISFEHVHIAINSVVLFSLMVLIEKLVLQNVKYDFASLIFIVTFMITLLGDSRYLYVRPDLLSGLYILLALSFRKNSFLPLFIITLVYTPSYYLFFLYTGSIGLVTLVQQRYRAFWGVFLGSLFAGMFFLIQDAANYLQFIQYILSDQSLRQGLEVSEGRPLFDFLSLFNYYVLVALFFSVASFIIYKYYDYFRDNSIALFLLITSILWVNQARYFQLLLPLFFIFLLMLIINSDKKMLLYQLRKIYIISIKSFKEAKTQKLFYLIAVPYVIAYMALDFHNNSQTKEVTNRSYFTNEIFQNKTIISSTMNIDMYYASYLNPTIKMVPSCSIGWFDDSNQSMKDLYIKLLKNDNNFNVTLDELELFLNYVQADYYLQYSSKVHYDFQELKEHSLKPVKFLGDKILFKFTKNESKDAN